MRVLVCGGRDYKNSKFLFNKLQDIPITVLIQGEARGADALAKQYAIKNNIEYESYPANWQKYGKGAGYRRNSEMLKKGKPELVVAFTGGKGTDMMVSLAIDNGTDVLDYREK